MSRKLASQLNSHIFTACEIFPDGTALELIRDPSKADESRLLEWRGRVINVGTSVEHCGLRYVPIELEPSVSTAVRFPVRVSPREGVRDLFTATELLMGCYLGLSGPNLTLTVAWQLASWVYDVLAHAPVLWITASPQSATHVALQIRRHCEAPSCWTRPISGPQRKILFAVRPGLEHTSFIGV